MPPPASSEMRVGVPPVTPPLRLDFARIELGLFWLLVLVAVAFAGVTGWELWRSFQSVTPDFTNAYRWLWIDFSLLLVLALLLLSRFIRYLTRWRSHRAGAGLLLRILRLFALASLFPTVAIGIFSAIFFNLGVEQWFAKPVETAINEAEQVAQSYFEEHKRNIQIDILEVASALNENPEIYFDPENKLVDYINQQAWQRSFTEVVILNRASEPWAIGGISPLSSLFRPVLRDSYYERAEANEVVIIERRQDEVVEGRIWALTRLQFQDAFIFVGKLIDANVLARVRVSGEASRTYRELEASTSQVQFLLFLIFGSGALLLLLVVMGAGMIITENLVAPISSLIRATQSVGEGPLEASKDLGLPVEREDEMGSLARAFAKMNQQLFGQQMNLQERQKFVEAVLSGVSAGVLGLDGKGWISTANRRALDLLGVSGTQEGKALREVNPEIGAVFERAQKNLSDTAQSGEESNQVYQEEIPLITHQKSIRQALVTVVSEGKPSSPEGYVITFDDITEFRQAERQAAWSDIARRIAHEIKNPLTPIQLSAERLRRRFSSQIDKDRETFDLCADTIIRQVRDIGQMVDEFSNFARATRQEREPVELKSLVERMIFLQKSARPDLTFTVDLPKKDIRLELDERLINQALVNLVKNASEALEGAREGQIRVSLLDQRRQILIAVEDSGPGIPSEIQDRILEPYVTTRAQGTGLGLAIAKKIVEDHQGELLLDPGPRPRGLKKSLGGALVLIRLNKSGTGTRTAPDTSR